MTIDALRSLVMRNPYALAFAQFAVTGERVPRRLPLLADAVRRGPCSFVVDLGCGAAPLLDFISPDRYVGVEGSAVAIGRARREHTGEGREFVTADLREVPLSSWSGADVAVISSVTHHLDDDAVRVFLRRVRDELQPKRLLLQDAEPTGALGPLVRVLDDGRHLRSERSLVTLLEVDFEVTTIWRYDNPLRSFRQFLLELEARRPAEPVGENGSA